VGTSSGTAAWHALLAAHGIGPGDEVIIPSHTFIATVEGVWQAGATPVFGEIDPHTMLMHPIAAEAMITPRTRAICPVHLYGRLADMAAFREVCNHWKLLLFEDAAQAHGARPSTPAQGLGLYPSGSRAGTLADGAVFSFYPGKNLGALGDAGLALTPDPEIAAHLRQFINHGRAAKYAHDFLAWNYRMDTLQAAMLAVKLPHLDEWNHQRRIAAQRYHHLLEGLEGIQRPSLDAHEGHVWHLYAVRVDHSRDAVLESLNKAGVQAGVHYPIPCHLQPALRSHFQAQPGLLLETEQAAAQVLSLPLFPGITEAQQQRVATALAHALGNRHS
jgi:dTDP-4-amino-4,6-dideoxygalactose transaminase